MGVHLSWAPRLPGPSSFFPLFCQKAMRRHYGCVFLSLSALFRTTWPWIQHSPCRSTDLRMISWLSWIRSLGLSWLSAEVRVFLWSLPYLRCSWGGPWYFVIKHLEFLLSVEVALMWLSFCNSHHGNLSFHNQHGRDSRGRKDITISYSITHTSCHSSDTCQLSKSWGSLIPKGRVLPREWITRDRDRGPL